MLANDYPLGFKTRLHLKDLGIALDLARELGAVAAPRRAGRAARDGLIARGHGDEDMSALARAIRDASGLE